MTSLETTDYLLEDQVALYPNPASSIINIELEDITQVKVTIFDMNGRALQSENSMDNKITIQISNLANGIYLLQIVSDKGKSYKKNMEAITTANSRLAQLLSLVWLGNVSDYFFRF